MTLAEDDQGSATERNGLARILLFVSPQPPSQARSTAWTMPASNRIVTAQYQRRGRDRCQPGGVSPSPRFQLRLTDRRASAPKIRPRSFRPSFRASRPTPAYSLPPDAASRRRPAENRPSATRLHFRRPTAFRSRLPNGDVRTPTLWYGCSSKRRCPSAESDPTVPPANPHGNLHPSRSIPRAGGLRHRRPCRPGEWLRCTF